MMRQVNADAIPFFMSKIKECSCDYFNAANAMVGGGLKGGAVSESSQSDNRAGQSVSLTRASKMQEGRKEFRIPWLSIRTVRRTLRGPSIYYS